MSTPHAARADILAPFIALRGVVTLDGALATELERRGADLRDPLWSARVLIDAPSLIREVHDAYFEAGADVAITATYQASFEGFAARGIGSVQAEALMRRAVQIAIDSRDAFWSDPRRRVGRARPLVAASVGPYGAFLADGSEYRGHYALDEPALVEWHRPRFALLADSGADLLACETLPCGDEARAMLRLLDEHPATLAWISCSARDGTRLSDGTSFAELAGVVGAHPQVVAVGVNCTAPEHVAALVRSARERTSVPIVVYPNSGETWVAGEHRWHGDAVPVSFASCADAWFVAGATLIGGCCRTTPDDIRALAATRRDSPSAS